ncbi:ArsR/SmtB family transcription factor [Lysinimonas soli]|uniref:ArsR/SmtB family transcription factor n=1 Tax=Lysinimonas soli TaxID=1074233 RepID=A0ABW0NNT8_9MICO
MDEAQRHGSSALPSRDLDMESLKALSHPLRVQLLDALSVYGPATASGLGERLGESSGATSYHLRQLERHGFVREQEGRGTGRERWWERVPGSINIGSSHLERTPAGRAASQLIYREFRASQQRLLNDFIERGDDELPPDWADISEVRAANARLTIDQMREFVASVNELIEHYVVAYRDQDAPGARPVHIEFDAFAVVDAAVQTPGDAS